MTDLGELCLLVALVASGYAAVAGVLGRTGDHPALRRSGSWAALLSVAALSTASAILAWALATKDYRFEYVVQNCDLNLPGRYALAAFWVGQSGSLLLWAWFLAILATVYRGLPSQQPAALREPAFAALMAFLCFLVAVMVFGADPMQRSLVARAAGGLSPALQHPAMLIHPPIVFLGYAAWGVPCALALAALATGQLDGAWARAARPWALFAWAVLGAGILIGAEWAYEELGWGGYWGWDPVENGSLLPWLTGTALVHCLMTCRHAGLLKKTTLLLAVATFGLCNFATFLTRSGILDSLHAFGRSAVGWMFLGCMIALAAGGIALVVWRRAALVAERPIRSLFSREAMVVLATVALLLLTTTTVLGTLAAPLSGLLPGPTIAIGPGFYNSVLIPTGLVLLTAIAATPLLRWGNPPTAAQRKLLLLCLGAGAVAASLALAAGARHPLALAVAGLAAAAVAATFAALVTDAQRQDSNRFWFRPLRALAAQRRQYAGFCVHLGLACLAVGVAGSSLGTQRREATMQQGETIVWAGRSVRFVELAQRDEPGKIVIEAQLEVTPDGGAPFTIVPAQHFHRLQNEWATEVAIHSTWSGDFYTILHGGEAGEGIRLTLIENPAMRWLWLAGWIGAAGAAVGLWPERQRTASASLPPPHFRPRAKASATAGSPSSAVARLDQPGTDGHHAQRGRLVVARHETHMPSPPAPLPQAGEGSCT